MCHSFSVGTLTYASSLVPPGLFSNQIPGLENMVGSYGNGPFSCFHSNEHSDHLVASQLTAVSESDSVHKLRVRPWGGRVLLWRGNSSQDFHGIWGTHSHFLPRMAQQYPSTFPTHTTDLMVLAFQYPLREPLWEALISNNTLLTLWQCCS